MSPEEAAQVIERFLAGPNYIPLSGLILRKQNNKTRGRDIQKTLRQAKPAGKQTRSDGRDSSSGAEVDDRRAAFCE